MLNQNLRVDIVGSFLRPAELKEAFRRHDAGEIDDAAFRAIQETAIRDLVRNEEAHGLPIVGDGEFRRRVFNQSFGLVAGMEPWDARLERGVTVAQAGVEAAGLKRDIGNEFRLHHRDRDAGVRHPCFTTIVVTLTTRTSAGETRS